MKVSSGRDDVLVTHALGSCLGIVLLDPVAHVGGLLHAMLPDSSIDPGKAAENPFMFVDTGLPQLFHECYRAGANRGRVVVKVAGGAAFREQNDLFAIGRRNYIMLRKLLWKNGFMIRSESVGGTLSRTVLLDIATGKTLIWSSGREWEI